MSSVLASSLKKLVIATVTLPSPRGWLSLGALLGVEAMAVYTIGTATGFLNYDEGEVLGEVHGRQRTPYRVVPN